MNKANLFLNNAYNVLALDINAPTKETLSNLKKLSQSLKYDTEVSFDSDLNFGIARTEINLNEAFQNLSSSSKKIREYFFWFENNNEIDRQFLNLIKSKEYIEALNFLKDATGNTNAANVFKGKNLGLIYIYLLYEQKIELIPDSLELWKKIITSQKFWNSFIKDFHLRDDLGTNEKIVLDFQKKVLYFLSDFYADISLTNNNPKYLLEFTKYFNERGDLINNSILDPAVATINKDIDKLRSLKVSEDGIFSDDEKVLINGCINQTQNQFETLRSFGLFEDSKIKVIRDNAVELISKISIDLNNNLGETKNALMYSKIALEICGTSSLKNKIEEDIKILEKIDLTNEIIEPINTFLNDKNFDLALSTLEKEIKKATDEELLERLNEIKKVAITDKAYELREKAFEQMNKKQWSDAQNTFEIISKLIKKNKDIFNFIFKPFEELVENTVSRIFYSYNSSPGETIENSRKIILDIIEKNFPETIEGPIILCYFDSRVYFSLITRIKDVEEKNKALRKKKTLLGIFIPIGVIALIIVIIFANINNNSSNNNVNNSETTKIFVEQESTIPEKTETYEREEEVKFVENVGNIIDGIDSAISRNNNNANTSNIDDFISSERSFLRNLESLNSDLKILNYPTSCITYRNNLCSIFDDLCSNERSLINSLEAGDSTGYDSDIRKINNNLDDFINTYNSMLSYLQNR